MKDMGWNVECRIHSDATTAIGICRRQGLGKVRHLDCTDLWIQEACRAKRFSLNKVDGKHKPASVLPNKRGQEQHERCDRNNESLSNERQAGVCASCHGCLISNLSLQGQDAVMPKQDSLLMLQ